MNCLLMCLNFIRLRFNKMEQLVTLTHTHYGRTSCCMIGAIEVPVVKGTLAHFICTMPPRDELGILDFCYDSFWSVFYIMLSFHIKMYIITPIFCSKKVHTIHQTYIKESIYCPQHMHDISTIHAQHEVYSSTTRGRHKALLMLSPDFTFKK